jgi:hypothetical protein
MKPKDTVQGRSRHTQSNHSDLLPGKMHGSGLDPRKAIPAQKEQLMADFPPVTDIALTVRDLP